MVLKILNVFLFNGSEIIVPNIGIMKLTCTYDRFAAHDIIVAGRLESLKLYIMILEFLSWNCITVHYVTSFATTNSIWTNNKEILPTWRPW